MAVDRVRGRFADGPELVLFQNSAERESVRLQGFVGPQTRHSRSTWGVLDPVLRRRTIGSHVKHYHLERCHQGLGNRPIEGVPKPSEGTVLRHEWLGGLLSHYYGTTA